MPPDDIEPLEPKDWNFLAKGLRESSTDSARKEMVLTLKQDFEIARDHYLSTGEAIHRTHKRMHGQDAPSGRI